jgi:hypothetical protein
VTRVYAERVLARHVPVLGGSARAAAFWNPDSGPPIDIKRMHVARCGGGAVDHPAGQVMYRRHRTSRPCSSREGEDRRPRRDDNRIGGTKRGGRSATRDWGPWLVGGGLLLLVGGLLAWTGALSWLGNLPGDVRISSGTTRIYIPITSMLLVSAALNVLLWLFVSLFHR